MFDTRAIPHLSPTQVSEMVLRLYSLTVSVIQQLPSFNDQNFYLATTRGGSYILKIMNTEDSKNRTLFEVQTHAMTFVYQCGLPAQTALPTTTGELMSLQEIDCGFGPQKYLVRLLTYLPGTIVSKVPSSPELLYEIGKSAAKMDMILQEMKHPDLSVLQRDDLMWSLSNIHLLEDHIHLLDGDPVQQLVKSVIQCYKTSVVPARSDFRKSIIHGDFNHRNVLVQPDKKEGYRISGIIDFTEMNCGYYIYELAITIMYMMIEHPEPLEVGGPVLAGWESVLPLNEAERDALYLLVLSRFCQSLVYSPYSVLLQPENEEYLLMTAKNGVHIFQCLWQLGKKRVEMKWFQSAAQFCHRM